MDGFVRRRRQHRRMGYWDGTDLPFYYSLAPHVPDLRPMVLLGAGQTYPNRRFLQAGHLGRAS